MKIKITTLILLSFTMILPVMLLANHVDVITIQGAITPVSAKYLSDSIRDAEKDGAICLIIEMDTPGGLMQATWDIDKQILASRVPVVVYITPSGGRAASAGVFISFAAHVTAMAPSTNIGSAHPVTMGGKDSSKVMLEKVTNDAVAHIKGLAKARHRNAEWAEKAVRESVNITEEEALELGVIDVVAKNRAELLSWLDGRQIQLADGSVTLHTENTEIVDRPMNWQYKILSHIADPNIAYILMMIGIYGIIFELKSPGAIFPGVLGGIALVLAFFSLQVLPINIAGLLLIILAIIFWILEVHVPSFGLLTIGGVVAFVLGSLMLFKTPEVKVSISYIIIFTVLMVLFFAVGLGLALRTRLTKATTGKQGLAGEIGLVVKALNPEGQVSVHGEVWKAESTEKIAKGQKVEVIEVNGLRLKVKRIS